MQTTSTLRRQVNWILAFSLLGFLSFILLQNAFGGGLSTVSAQTIPESYYSHGKRMVVMHNANEDEDESENKNKYGKWNNGNHKGQNKNGDDKKVKAKKKIKGNTFVNVSIICSVNEQQLAEIKTQFDAWVETRKVKKQMIEFAVVDGDGQSLSEFKEDYGLEDCVVVRKHKLWYLLFNTVEIS